MNRSLHRSRLALTFASAACSLATIAGTGCSSAPMTRGSATYYGPTRDQHEWVRTQQDRQFGGRLIDTQQSLEQLQAGLNTEDCYKVTQTYTQWGIYQPETVFLGEGVFNATNKAYIFVTPTFEEKEVFITPREAGGMRVYRLDADAPFTNSLTRQIEAILGKPEYCVKMSRMENRGEKNPAYAVTSASIQLTAKAIAPQAKPERAERKEVAPAADAAKSATENKTTATPAAASPDTQPSSAPTKP